MEDTITWDTDLIIVEFLAIAIVLFGFWILSLEKKGDDEEL